MQKITLSSPTGDKYITPSKVVCVGRNYVEHIYELNNEIPTQLVLFTKPNSAISQQLKAKHSNDSVHYEVEICFMYQQGQFMAAGVGIDLTKRELQATLKQKGLPWERAKAFDGSVLFSDFVPLPNIAETEFEVVFEQQQEVLQRGVSSQMITKPAAILQEIQSFMTLEDGDIVMTGTPKGVGEVNAGGHYTASLYIDGQRVVAQSWDAA
ncbi:fumarylacetoacetate hydrolase family protein [Photobacterium sp. GB-1]|uniref:fumarylacetoacetate hydrolase family protein n=1 Tax=Photobacterium sp. GB-1 TaxID=2022111 RepID=UPI000D1761F7|nr:fumarylacetoacetate hydrolase family protein [Photobacterium sp. GB-1]PSV51477.1 2-keto-4-pentenoate hydratase [Photobacterium sp. GB-1]